MLKALLSLFLQQNCPLCQRPCQQEICQDCERQLRSNQVKNTSQFWSGELPLFCWGNYEGKLKQAIATLKYDRHPDLGVLLGQWLGETWLRESPVKQQQIAVIPIPLHQRKLKDRGFNQAEAIAHGFCQITGASLQTNGLIRVRETQAMHELKPKEREKNIKNAFTIGKISNNRAKVLLIDDIYTTGATAREAVRCMRSHHVPVLGIATISTVKQG